VGEGGGGGGINWARHMAIVITDTSQGQINVCILGFDEQTSQCLSHSNQQGI